LPRGSNDRPDEDINPTRVNVPSRWALSLFLPFFLDGTDRTPRKILPRLASLERVFIEGGIAVSAKPTLRAWCILIAILALVLLILSLPPRPLADAAAIEATGAAFRGIVSSSRVSANRFPSRYCIRFRDESDGGDLHESEKQTFVRAHGKRKVPLAQQRRDNEGMQYTALVINQLTHSRMRFRRVDTCSASGNLPRVAKSHRDLPRRMRFVAFRKMDDAFTQTSR